jgi:hypothetical protein
MKKNDDLRSVKLFGLSILQWMAIIIVAAAAVIVVHEYF